MNKGRMETFSDGLLAIVMTIMVLELKPPHEASLAALTPLWPVFLSYLLSFIYLGIYWNNHHHLLQVADRVDGRILWANLNLLFWLSLVPFVTAWMGENHFAGETVALYGVILLCAACAYTLLTRSLIRTHGKESTLGRALGSDFKGRLSLALYVLAIASAFWCSWVACALYAGVAAMWLVPDSRMEKALAAKR